MNEVILSTTKRTLAAKALAELRAQGLVPGVVYGQGKDSTLIQADAKSLDKAYHEAGSNRLVQLGIDQDKPVAVLFHEVQTDPISRQIIHFDLYTVRMDEKIKTNVPIHFLEEAPAVHTLSAILLKNLEEIEIEALPANLPENFEVDLSQLTEIGDSVHVKDLKVPEGVTILTDGEELIVKTDPPRSEEELAELDEAIDEDAEAAVAAEKGGEEEGEEGAEAKEGEEAPAEAEAQAEAEKKEDQS